ncbi:hypothetical protein RUE5091_04547 [Ruegeria denitrificans]|uniref:Uncharacterized protein n=1 Tax=Ruegeria denitrificans TaxID=1715692 RepID=A0A0P1IT86_9RHOB|nr:DUF6635 family protein [Ruegeria denitrificans]CUK20705.1 hypothetical protein RUE5091_04547 [Ruegeria denitrificans]
MRSLSNPAVAVEKVVRPKVREYFMDRRAEVDVFVARHFTWPGTLLLHRSALGWDILRAPMNVVLSPILVLTRIAAYLCRCAQWRGGADWLASRRILLRTTVARRVEACVVADLLQLSLAEGAAAQSPEALTRAILGAPKFREMIRKRESAADAEALSHRMAGAISEYTATRSAVAEMTTVLCALVVGALVFQALTPGMISMAPGVADAMASTNAITEFPLGQTIGGIWYGFFPTDASPWLITVTMAGLVMIGSVFAAFAGAFADPVQSRLGIHRRRLLRLIDTLEVELTGLGQRPFVAREHFYARLLDLWDAGAGILRIFRN